MRIVSLGHVVLALLAVVGSASPPDRQNAATWYRKAADLGNVLSDQEWGEIENFVEAPTAVPSDRIRALLGRLSRARSFVLRGSRQPFSDFYTDLFLDYDGAQMFPPTNHNRRDVPRLATLMRADARLRMHDGDNLRAMESLAATYRMGRHVAEDLHEISSYVGYTIFRLADMEVQSALDRGVLGPAESDQMIRVLRDVGTDDPFLVTETFANTWEVGLNWYEWLYESGQTERLERFLERFRPEEDLDLIAMEKGEFYAAIDQASAIIDLTVETMLLDEPPATKAARLREICDSIDGSLVAQLLPTLEQTIGSVYVIPKAEKIVADRIDILDDIAREEVLKEEYANAAIWYLRGIENLNRIADDQLVAVHKFLSDPKKITIESELAQAFDQVQKALDVFREGSLIHRCDFSLARMVAVLKYGERRNDLVLIPTYIPGMYEAMRLLHADAKRLLHAGDIDSSVDRLATCYRMVSHLGTDPLLVSSLTSHKAFKDAMLLSEVVLAHDNWDEKHRPELAKALDRMSRKDPCGYIKSILKARKGLAKAFRFWLKGMTSSDIDKNKRALRKWNGDQLLYGLIILNALKAKDLQPKIDTEPGGKAVSPGNAPVAKDAQEELAEQLAEILSLEGLKQAKAQAESDVPLLMTGGLEAMLELPIPAIGAVEECKSAARRDLRKARSLLEPL